MKRFHLAQLDELPGVDCPCGVAHRAFGDVPDAPASVHWTEIRAAALDH